jgi:hypothetical protein
MRPLLRTLVTVALCLVVLGPAGCDVSNLPPPPPKDKSFCNVTAVPCATFKYKQCCVGSTCAIDFCTPTGFDPVCISDSDCVLPIGCSGVICGGFLQDPAAVTNPALCPTIPASAPGAGDATCFHHTDQTPQDACGDLCAAFGGGLNAINWPTAGNLRSRCSAALNTDPAYHSGLVNGYVPNGCVDPSPPPFPLASQGTNAVALSGSGTVSLDGNSAAVSIKGGFFDITAPFTTCTALQATCPTQINQVEVDFADFTLDGHSIQGLTLKLDAQVLTASGVRSGSFFIFTIPQSVEFDAIATVDGQLTGLTVTSTQQVDGSIDLGTGSLAFQFDLTGTFNGKTLEATGVATSASVVALAPVVTAGPITVVDSPQACSANVTLTASATSAAGLPVTLDYIVDNQLVGSGASVTTTMAIGVAHHVTITGTDTNGMQDTVTESVTPTDTLGPVVTTVPSRITLWPPNHTYATVRLDQCVTSVVDQCGGSLSPLTQGQITSVTSNEPALDPPSDTTCNDMVIVDHDTVKVRAERDEDGQGRVYTIHFTESDLNGNATAATCTVQVTHDQSGPPALDSAPVTCVGTSCGAVPPPSC